MMSGGASLLSVLLHALAGRDARAPGAERTYSVLQDDMRVNFHPRRLDFSVKGSKFGRKSFGEAIFSVGDGKFFIGEVIFFFGDDRFSVGEGVNFFGKVVFRRTGAEIWRSSGVLSLCFP
jgi:hypothetical protein